MSKIVNGINYIGVNVGGTPTEYVWKTVEIGDWNMDTTTTVLPAHGLSGTEWKTVRSIDIMIRTDDDTAYYNIDANSAPGAVDVFMSLLNSTHIYLARTTSGSFDNSNFDSTSYNRGWVTFMYKPD